MMMTIDLFPTLANLVGAKLPEHKIDGLDILPMITGQQEARNPHEFYAFYYEQNQLQAIMSADGQWKLQLPHTYRAINGGTTGSGGTPGLYKPTPIEKAELYRIDADLSEGNDVSAQHPDIVAKLEGYAEQMRADLGDSLTKRQGNGNRPAGVAEPVP